MNKSWLRPNLSAQYLNALTRLVRESNKIEGIVREPTDEEMDEAVRFMELDEVTVADLERFVSIYQPSAILRRPVGLDVRVGGYVAPPGGPRIEQQLTELLRDIKAGLDPYEAHLRYETLHPFSDGNGRSGRMLWAWQMGPFKINLGFLHTFYYQTLNHYHG